MPFGIPENFEASSRGLPHKLIGSCVMPFVVDMSMCFFSLAHGTPDCGTSRLAPWNPSFLGEFDMFLP
jgi:hypothetical protein